VAGDRRVEDGRRLDEGVLLGLDASRSVAGSDRRDQVDADELVPVGLAAAGGRTESQATGFTDYVRLPG
jgi:hypothetical protein